MKKAAFAQLTTVRDFLSAAKPFIIMILIAFALRMAVVAFLYEDQLDPARDHWTFAYETGRVARSIATGEGFGNPQYEPTGPTALMPPLFPYLLAAVFKIFGVYSKASAIVILGIQSFFSAISCVPIFFFTKKSFGERAAKWAAWGWVFFPYAIYFSADWVWSTCITTFLLSVLFLMALHLGETTTWWKWASFGLLYAVTALTDPIVLAVLPFLGGWAAYGLYRQKRGWLKPAAISAIVFLVTISPWFVRNYRTFHTVIPVRDGFGLELYTGNNGYTEHWVNRNKFPAHNPDELAQYKQLGEIEYMSLKKRQGLEYIASHPGSSVWLAIRRAGYIWTGFWSFSKAYLQEEPLDPFNVVVCSVLSVLTLIGLFFSFRNRLPVALPYLAVLLFFPLVYCATHPEVYYRRPIDPIFVSLAAYAIVRWRTERIEVPIEVLEEEEVLQEV